MMRFMDLEIIPNHIFGKVKNWKLATVVVTTAIKQSLEKQDYHPTI